MTIAMTQPTSADYLALRDDVAVHPRPAGGALVLTSDDRVDFLQRMTTNDIAVLQPGRAAVTVLTTSTARIHFVFTVVAQPDALVLLPALGQTAALANFLRSQIFFMDKVKVDDVSASFARLRVMGPNAGAALAAAGIDLTDVADGTVVEQGDVLAVWQERFDIPGIEMLVPVQDEALWLEQLTGAGALVISDISSLKARRVELGRPGVGRELSDAYNPLEVGLAWVCSDDKGCYTGQEIIARQITYDKITRDLVGLRSKQMLPEGIDVTVDGRSVGKVTSAAYSPTLIVPVALAVLKRPHYDVGTRVDIAGVAAEVVGLPFVPANP